MTRTGQFPCPFHKSSILYICVCTCVFQKMATYSKENLRELEGLAQRYIENKGESFRIIHSLYRNKPQEYFDEINGRDGTMTTRVKDSGGDPRCPLNRRLSGLFFFGWVTPGGRRLDSSPFGNRRIIIPIHHLFTEGHRLYFADFYCMSDSEHHYVTLVVTNRQSEADTFCKENLLSLDMCENPYMKVSDGEVNIAANLWVEVFYTEDINIREVTGINYEKCEIIGKGESKPDGIPKNLYCEKCNLPA